METTVRKTPAEPEQSARVSARRTSSDPKISDLIAEDSAPAPDVLTVDKPLIAKAKPSAAPTRHEHPPVHHTVVDDVIDGGRRITRTQERDRSVYFAGCRLCQLQDRERMQTEPPPIDFERTLFFVPETDYDQQIARAYILHRYGEEAQNIVHAFNAEKLTYVRGAQIIVVVRRALPGKMLGKREKRIKDEEGKWDDQPVPPETYLNEIVESAPIIVEDVVRVTKADMYNEGSVDMSELIERLGELVFPNKVQLPADPRDKMYVMRANT